MSGVRTFVAADEGSAACGLVEEAVGISRELRRKMVFRRTEIAGSEKKSVLINFPPPPKNYLCSKEFLCPYLGVQREAWSNRPLPVSQELSRRVNCVSKDPTRYI